MRTWGLVPSFIPFFPLPREGSSGPLISMIREILDPFSKGASKIRFNSDSSGFKKSILDFLKETHLLML